MPRKKVKSTFSFDEEASEKLNELAEESGSTRSEILRRAIALFDFVQDSSDEAGRIVFKDKDGKEVTIILP